MTTVTAQTLKKLRESQEEERLKWTASRRPRKRHRGYGRGMLMAMIC